MNDILSYRNCLSGRKKQTVVLLLSFITTPLFSSSKAPLMGWASWNNFSVNINETIIRNQADAMIASGLATAGYQYINIDDGYFNGRYADGTLRVDSIKFPNGMKILVDYIHAIGLKAGIYTDAGANTCGSLWNAQSGGRGVGMYNHDSQDADLFFKIWGFDYLKADFCGGQLLKLDEKTRYTEIKNAIEMTGRKDVIYNVCRWQFPGTWVTTLADSWRMSQDIRAKWSSVIRIIDKNTYLAAYASQGHYNDMDMLEVGRGMTVNEDKSHFSMWCILSSPLVLGNDLSKLSPTTQTILTNSEVIAVNQDTTGLQARLVSDNGAGLQVWAKNLNGRQSNIKAVALFNRTSKSARISIKWKELDLVGPAQVRDLWRHADLGSIDSIFTAKVPSHGVVMLKVTGSQARLQETFEAEYGWINNFNLTQNNAVIPNQGVAVSDKACSGRAKVKWLGNRADNYLEFRDIYANADGTYPLTLSYLCGENRNATIYVNGIDTLLTDLNSGDFSVIGTVKFPVKLNKGYNTIRIANATGWLPDIDKIELDLY